MHLIAGKIRYCTLGENFFHKINIHAKVAGLGKSSIQQKFLNKQVSTQMKYEYIIQVYSHSVLHQGAHNATHHRAAFRILWLIEMAKVFCAPQRGKLTYQSHTTNLNCPPPPTTLVSWSQTLACTWGEGGWFDDFSFSVLP